MASSNCLNDYIKAILGAEEELMRNKNICMRTFAMHPEDLREFVVLARPLCPYPLEKRDIGIYRFSGIDLIEDETAPRIPRKPAPTKGENDGTESSRN